MKKLSIKRILLTVLLVVCVSACLLSGWIAWSIATDKPPEFFPLNNAQGEYTITKRCPSGQGWEEKKDVKDTAYCLEYKGSGVMLSEEYNNSNFFAITIGKSKIDLKLLDGKKVKNIKGKYASSSQQCVQNKCIDIGGPWAVINIDNSKIEE